MFLVIIGGVIVGIASEFVRNELARPVDASSDAAVEFTVAPGQAVSDVATNLKQADLIRQPLLFRLMASRQNAADKLQAGTYQLSKSMTMSQIITKLQSAPTTEEKQFTIIPGSRMEEVAEALVSQGIVSDTETFLTVARDAAPFKATHTRLESIPAGQGLEGYLFPDTYRIAATATVTDVIEKILTDGFDKNYESFETQVTAQNADGTPLTVHQIVTMASIVQREAVNDQEMAHLAYIFWNRLKPENANEVNGRLQADPTLQYALGKPGDWWPKLSELTPDEINNNPSPYNTRKVQGLPPGPIASSGLAALKAAARPGSDRPDGSPGDKDLYFVARCGNSLQPHQFAATNAEFAKLPGANGSCQ